MRSENLENCLWPAIHRKLLSDPWAREHLSSGLFGDTMVRYMSYSLDSLRGLHRGLLY